MSRGRALAIVAMLACACKGKDSPRSAQGSDSGSAPAAIVAAGAANDWDACKAALVAAPALPPTRRPQALIDGCHPCGDWTPILDWMRLPADGGPTRSAIEAAMTACKAYCDPDARQRFLGTLDDARMKESRTPWRELGLVCKDKVSAVPDPRYMSATLFALDRIARDVATHPDGAKLLDAIEIPMPPVSASGVGVTLPDAPVSKPELMRAAITVTVKDISIGALPVAKLSGNGVTIGGDVFPGALVTLGDLPAALAKVGGRVAVFAPAGMPAARLVEVVQGIASEELVLAVTAQPGPGGWAMYGIVPVLLKPARSIETAGVSLALAASADAAIKAAKAAGKDKLRQGTVTVVVDRTATVASLATLIGALAYFEVTAVAFVPLAPP